MWPLLIVLIPLLGAFYLIFFKKRTINIVLFTSIILLILGVMGLKSVTGSGQLIYRLPFTGPFVPVFSADSLNLIFVTLAALLWLVISFYSPHYMKEEGRKAGFRYHFNAEFVCSNGGISGWRSTDNAAFL